MSIPWSRRYNYKISMKVVGPPGLEPGTKGFGVAGALQMNSRCATKSPAGFTLRCGFVRKDPQRPEPFPHWKPAVVADVAAYFRGLRDT